MNRPSFDNSCEVRQPGSGILRRDFLRVLARGALVGSSLSMLDLPILALGDETAGFDALVPADKRLNPNWIRSLFERGTPAVYKGTDLAYIGMPVGGLCAGQLYLGGDGQLWNWDLFNQPFNSGCNGERYVHPVVPKFPLEQAFSIQIGETSHSLDAHGFTSVSFRGEYPIGKVSYSDPAIPLSVELEAFSPFIPLDWADSSLPATVMRFTVKNTSAMPVQATLTGELQNGAGMYTGMSAAVEQTNRIVSERGFTFLDCSVKETPVSANSTVVFENWNANTYTGWTVEGEAFGSGPVTRAQVPPYMGDMGGQGVVTRFVSSHIAAPGTGIGEKDAKVGKLTSKTFTIDKNFIRFWIAGGNNPGQTCINLMVDGKVVRSQTGQNSNTFMLESFDVKDLRGKQAHLEIVDSATASWGNIDIGPITFSDTRKPAPVDFQDASDYGTMGLALLGLPADKSSPNLFPNNGKLPIGSLSRLLRLAPGASAEVDFVVTWCFPNLTLTPFLVPMKRSYGNDFASAIQVARYVVDNLPRLTGGTRLWRDTWYDSTLPYWFLDRTFLNTSILATETAYRFSNGRFYGWEGVGSCPGTCTHVWNYAQAPARLFPELERSARRWADFDPGSGYNESNGSIGNRAEYDRSWAADGMAGCIIRAYREHEMSPDDSFLISLWPRIRQSVQFLMAQTGSDGLLAGPQANTLDSQWFGPVAWLSGVYAAALRAGEEMAKDMGDKAFAETCHAAFLKCQASLVGKLFNGEYFINIPDPAHPESINSGSGCEIDQVLGQSLAWQVGLGRITPEKETKEALQSLWKYNFAPDVGPFREKYPQGRWYAVRGEAGLIMCTFPKPDWDFAKASGKGNPGFAGYFNECMNGFEYQVAGHMINEGMVMEGLAITRAVHDRYSPSKRNPWNEIECGDHYSRSMASYGVFLAACGYRYDGPKGYLGFAPRLTPEDFRAAFTTAEGWGTYFQKITGRAMHAGLLLRYGKLKLRTLSLTLPEGVTSATGNATLDGMMVDTTSKVTGRELEITFGKDFQMTAGDKLEVSV